MTRSICIALVTSALMLCLSGCVPFDGGAVPFIGLRSVDGVLEFKDCSPISANQIAIRQGAEGGAPRDMEWAWIASSRDSSDSSVVATITYGIAPDGMVAQTGPAAISSKSVIQFSILKLDGSTVLNARQATFHLEQLPDDGWLMASGKVVAEPCD